MESHQYLRLAPGVPGAPSRHQRNWLGQATQGAVRDAVSIPQRQDKNEQLAMRASAISEEDLEAVRAEAATRVAAAERKVGPLRSSGCACRRACVQPVQPTAHELPSHALLIVICGGDGVVREPGDVMSNV